jgi:hypothetical protein
VTSLAPEGEPVDGVLDGIGGPVLGAALQRVRSDGVVVYPTRSFFVESCGARLYGLYPLPWAEAGTAITKLIDNEVAGKAVLTL